MHDENIEKCSSEMECEPMLAGRSKKGVKLALSPLGNMFSTQLDVHSRVVTDVDKF